MTEFNGHHHPSQPKVLAEIQIRFTDNGQVAVDCKGHDVVAIFYAMGMATSHIAEQAKKQMMQQVQPATPELTNRLLKL